MRENEQIKVGVSINKYGHQITNVNGISCSVEDTSILEIEQFSSTNDTYFFVLLNGVSKGTTYVNFSDSLTGAAIRVPVTVYQDHLLSFTTENVPSQKIEKYESNFYNVNGFFIDNYKCTYDDDGGANLSFDVYNTNHTYGVVEIYNENGQLIDACVIDKMKNNSTSIKGALWDNLVCLYRDIIDGDLLTYRQESGFSVLTSIDLYVPKGGYIAITNDTMTSPLAAIINGVDLVMQITSLYGTVEKYNPDDLGFKEALTKKIIASSIFIEGIKDGEDFVKNLNKNIARKTVISNESLGSFANTFSSNIANLNIDEIVLSFCVDYGVSVAENVFIFLSGPIGKILKACFVGIEFGNTTLQFADYMAFSGAGAIYIANPNNDLRKISGIKIETSFSMSSDISLDVYTVEPSPATLKDLRDRYPDIYSEIRKGLSFSYNITMVNGGNETQPNGEVTVYIPIPKELENLKNDNRIKVYRQEENGDMTDMYAIIEGNMLVFKTNHFSLYTIVGFDGNDSTPVCDVLDYSYSKSSNGQIVIQKYKGNDSHIIVPSTIDGYVVQNINSGAFKNCSSLESVTLPSTLRGIYADAFYNCTNLKNIYIDKNTDSIAPTILKNCTSFVALYYDGAMKEWSEVHGLPQSENSKNIKVVCTDGVIIGNSSSGDNSTEDNDSANNGDGFDNPTSNKSSKNRSNNNSGTNLVWLWVIISVFAVGGTGFAFWWFIFRKKPINKI